MSLLMMPGYTQMDQEESIYNLIPRPQEVVPKPPMHKSKFPGKVSPKEFGFGDNKVAGHATFGRPNGTNAVPTTKILKAHEREPNLPNPAPPSQPKEKLKPPVPKSDEKPVMGLSSGKNFITTNAVEVILAKPKKPQEEFQWTQKPDYGKVPMYLQRNKQAVAREKDEFEQYIKMTRAPETSAHISQLTTDDRAQLLRHLKLKWQSLNTAYQKLSLSVDSGPKRLRKEELERQLAEVEKDIKTLERGEVVLVVDD